MAKIRKFKSIEELKAYYGNNPAVVGSVAECTRRYLVQSITTKKATATGCRPRNMADQFSRKLGNITIEYKVGTGWLTSDHLTKEEAETIKAEMLNGKNYGRDYVCYTPKATLGETEDDILDDSFILTAEDFGNLLRNYNLIRVRRSSHKDENGREWGVAIQQWITTPNWGSAKTRRTEESIFETLLNGHTLRSWLQEKGYEI